MKENWSLYCIHFCQAVFCSLLFPLIYYKIPHLRDRAHCCFVASSQSKDNLSHNTYQIYVKPHLKNTRMTLEYQIFDEKALA